MPDAHVCSCVQNKAAVEETHRLHSERTALIDTVKKLNRELSKLESLKKSLKAQLLDDTEVGSHFASSCYHYTLCA